MTQALENVFSQLSSLPADEQDRIAGWLQSELASEEGWTRRFAQSQDLLSALADEALADLAAGRTTDLDPDNASSLLKFRTKLGRHTEPSPSTPTCETC